jgi:hypothetical protein
MVQYMPPLERDSRQQTGTVEVTLTLMFGGCEAATETTGSTWYFVEYRAPSPLNYSYLALVKKKICHAAVVAHVV